MRLLSLSEVSIQKRTSPGKLGIRDFEISFAISQVLAIEIPGQMVFGWDSDVGCTPHCTPDCTADCAYLVVLLPAPQRTVEAVRVVVHGLGQVNHRLRLMHDQRA